MEKVEELLLKYAKKEDFAKAYRNEINPVKFTEPFDLN